MNIVVSRHHSSSYRHLFLLCIRHDFSLSPFIPWLCSSHGFCKHAREQYEKLSTMHKNMQKLYESIGNYFAFDPHSVSLEDFFGELANFRVLYMVSESCVHVLYRKSPTSSVSSKQTHRDQQKPPPTHALAFTHTFCHRKKASLKREHNVCVTNFHHFH